MDVSGLYTSIPHDNGIAATATLLTTTNCQVPNTILQLMYFILNHIVFTFDNQFFILTHGTATGTRLAPEYANIYMHRFEQSFVATQNLRSMLYTRYIGDIFFLWTQGEESLKQLHSNINKFHPTIRLTMDYSLESVSFLDTCISIRDGHLSTSLYCKATDNFTMLRFPSFHPKHSKTPSPTDKPYTYTGSQKTVMTSSEDRQGICLIIQHFPRAEKLQDVLCSLQHIIDGDEHLAMIFPTSPLLTFKQPPNLKQIIVRGKLPSLQDNIDHNTVQPCHGNLCKT
eukprot:g25605.t1